MLAIAGGKGGCGKTTTACALAGTLAAWGQAPVVVDADVAMPDLARRVQAGRGAGIDALAAGRPVSSVVQTDHKLPGVGVVASGAPSSLGPALQALRTVTGPVFVDCPGGAGPDVAAALSACDRTLVVSTETSASLEDAAKTVAMARELDASVAGLALRKADHTGVDGGAARVQRRLAVPWVVAVGRIPDPGTGDPPRAVRLARALFCSPGSRDSGDGPARDQPTRRQADPSSTTRGERRHRYGRGPTSRTPARRKRRQSGPG